MSIFQGILNDSNKAHHSYFIHEPFFEDLGLIYYTSGALLSYFQNNSSLVLQLFNSSVRSLDAMMGFGEYIEKPAILKFDNKNKTYIHSQDFLTIGTTTYTLKDLLLAHENNMSGVTIDTAAQSIVTLIQNSLSGCVTFTPAIDLKKAVTNKSQVSTTSLNPIIQLFFKEKEVNNNNERLMTVKGPPIITDVARRPTGGKYSWRKTEDKLGKEIGEYIAPVHGGVNNPNNTITGNLRTCYNKGLGMWESGTQQILARLLTDIDPASDIDAKLFEDVDNLDASGLYSPESLIYLASFTTGIAMPLSLHGANPYDFGPNIVGDDKKKEKIRVVNRAPIAFSKGDIVICSLIESEWIIQRFDAATKRKANKIGKWSFTKLIVNSDSFLKDDRLYSTAIRTGYVVDPLTNQYPLVIIDSGKLGNIDPSQYERYIRNRFYMSIFGGGAGDAAINDATRLKASITTRYKPTIDFQLLAKLNLYTPRYDNIFDVIDVSGAIGSTLPLFNTYDFIPSQGYIQSTIFDQLGAHMGGNNPNGNVISRTNIEHGRASAETSVLGIPYQDQLPIFWGPVFPDGYSPKETSKFKKDDITIQVTGDSNFFIAGQGSDILNKTVAVNKLKEPLDFMFADETDKLYQLPAEVGTNGSLSGTFSYPIEAIYKLLEYENGTSANADSYFYFLNSTERYSWLYKASDSGNVYGLTPYQPSRIQFSPLQLEFATHAYNREIIVLSRPQQTYYDKLKTSFKSFFQGNTSPQDGIWSYLNRRKSQKLKQNFPYIGVDTFINANGPIGGPNLLPLTEDGKERSNFIGIIGAKNKFYSTGSLTLTTKQYTGLPGNNQGSAGDGGYIQPIPIGPGVILQTPATNAINRSTPQWGSLFDTYDSFGTTGLHIRVFEQWPDTQTIYDARYFGVLHFNPIVSENIITASGSTLFNSGIKYSGPPWNPNGLPRFPVVNTAYEFSSDTILTSVDFRVPTYGHPTNPETDNVVIPIGTYIGKYGTGTGGTSAFHQSLRSPEHWRINPVRRNQLLTGGGFRYFKTVIGLSNISITKAVAGENYTIGAIINLDKDVVIQITSVTGDFKILDKGQGFMPSDFITMYTVGTEVKYGYKITIPNSAGKSAVFYFENGEVYDRISYDLGPKELTYGPTRLTLPTTNGGKTESYGSNVTTIDLGSPGKYDAFYFFHNDILHTVADREISPWIPGFAQYVTLEISAN